MAQVSFRIDDRVKRRAALRALAGSWKDDRKTSEIIHEIEGARTP